MHILIIEDDVQSAASLAKGLRESGHSIDHATDGETGLQHAQAHSYDVLIVDRMLPKLDGLAVIRKLREQGIHTPALVLSALGEVDDRVEGLRAGGDDYLVKPCAFSELLARLEVLLRRAQPGESETELHVDGLHLNLLTHKVTRSDRVIRLQPKELRLLEYLMRHAGQIVTRAMLLEQVWDFHFDPQTNLIDTQVSRLRAKIDKDFDTALLQTIRGKGYRLGESA